jgi:hypothetical protein
MVKKNLPSLPDHFLFGMELDPVGDIHQPLHAVARFSKALPEGDRGGN